MKRRLVISGVVWSYLTLTACAAPVRQEKLEAGYVLFAADAPEDLAICRAVHNGCIGGIPGTIASVGMDGRYIVAAQHPQNNKAITQYYFIDLTVPQSELNGVTGPLSQAAFDAQSRDLDLPRLTLKVDDAYALERPYKLSNYWPQ